MALNPHDQLVLTWWRPIEMELIRKVGPGTSLEQIDRLSEFYSKDLIDALHRIRPGRNKVTHVDPKSIVGSSIPLKDPHQWELDAQMVFARLHATEIMTFAESLQPASKYWCLCSNCFGSIDSALASMWESLSSEILVRIQPLKNDGWLPCFDVTSSCIAVGTPYTKTFTKKTYWGLSEESYETQCVEPSSVKINLWRQLR